MASSSFDDALKIGDLCYVEVDQQDKLLFVCGRSDGSVRGLQQHDLYDGPGNIIEAHPQMVTVKVVRKWTETPTLAESRMLSTRHIVESRMLSARRNVARARRGHSPVSVRMRDGGASRRH